MIQYVAAAAVDLGIRIVEAPENVFGAFAHDVGQHIQSSTMGHSQNDFLDTVVASFLQRKIQQRDQCLGTLKRKRFCTNEFLPHKLLEDHRVG